MKDYEITKEGKIISLKNNKSMKEIAEMYNVSLSCIKHIHANHTWTNI